MSKSLKLIFVGSTAGICLILIFWLRLGRKAEAIMPVKILFAYPITYLDPTLYDDWETVFIGNHIYVRLLPEEYRPRVPFVTKEIKATCNEPLGSDIGSTCRQIKMSFAPIPFTDCSGHRYAIDDIRKEFEALLTVKSWAIPQWKRCEEATSEICVIGKNTGDINRRMKNLNFRFGWSKKQTGDDFLGAGPYCLKAAFNTNLKIEAGILKPRDATSQFPPVEFMVGAGKDFEFNVALYGTKELLRGSRKNIQAHTPLAYYVVTNPLLAGHRLAWNTQKTKDTINAYLVRHEVFFPQTTGIEKLVPSGAALDAFGKITALDSETDFAIPDYLPGCRELAASLTASWTVRGRVKATCTNIVTFIQEKVREKRGKWSGFLVGVSPADPGRDSIKLQYFSKDSPDSWTYDYPRPDALFYLAGIGQSLVTVDGKQVCDLKPNVLGLGDVFVTDFVGCEK